MKLFVKVPFLRLLLTLLFTCISIILVSTLSSAVTIGDDYAGGIVIDVNDTGQHGLIAAKEDIHGHSSGEEEGFFTWNDAKDACNNFTSNGYNDWFLPDGKQLVEKIYPNRRILGIGTFTNHNYYWSSTKLSGSTAFVWEVDFSTGRLYHSNKECGSRVRAVRTF
jgi:Protein of unknown function (DUF1566)